MLGVRLLATRQENLKSKFGISVEQYEAMLDRQGSRCAICEHIPDEDEKRLAVDHNHDTNEVRGLLCVRCNMGLGYFRDNYHHLISAATYLIDCDGL